MNDERKNTKFMNLLLRMTNDCADHTVFVGTWLKKLKVWNRNDQQASVILNGSNKIYLIQKKFCLE